MDQNTKLQRRQDKAAVRAQQPPPEVVILSYPKSGRTWLSYLITGYAARLFGKAKAADPVRDGRLVTRRPEGHAKYINLVHERRTPERWVPIVAFVHRDGLDRPYFGPPHWRIADPNRYAFLVRDPRDVVTSHFHHVVHKNRGMFGGRPPFQLPSDYEIGEFIRSDYLGIRHVINYYARWGKLLQEAGRPIFYYEDLVNQPQQALSDLLRAIGVTAVEEPHLSDAIEAASFDRLSGAEKLSHGGDNPSLRRFRRGEIGSYKDELTKEDAAFVTRVLAAADVPILRRYVP